MQSMMLNMINAPYWSIPKTCKKLWKTGTVPCDWLLIGGKTDCSTAIKPYAIHFHAYIIFVSNELANQHDFIT